LVERDLGQVEHRRERVGIVVAMLAADVFEAVLGGFVPAMQRQFVIGTYCGPPRIDAG
jgi:hypothetical protein